MYGALAGKKFRKHCYCNALEVVLVSLSIEKYWDLKGLSSWKNPYEELRTATDCWFSKIKAYSDIRSPGQGTAATCGQYWDHKKLYNESMMYPTSSSGLFWPMIFKDVMFAEEEKDHSHEKWACILTNQPLQELPECMNFCKLHSCNFLGDATTILIGHGLRCNIVGSILQQFRTVNTL